MGGSQSRNPRCPMSHSLTIHRAAKRHIRAAFDWYERQSPGLGAGFLQALETALDRVAENPLLYAVIYRDVRRALLPRFPYGVFYFVQSGQINVVAILHTSRDPKRWPTRH